MLHKQRARTVSGYLHPTPPRPCGSMARPGAGTSWPRPPTSSRPGQLGGGVQDVVGRRTSESRAALPRSSRGAGRAADTKAAARPSRDRSDRHGEVACRAVSRGTPSLARRSRGKRDGGKRPTVLLLLAFLRLGTLGWRIVVVVLVHMVFLTMFGMIVVLMEEGLLGRGRC